MAADSGSGSGSGPEPRVRIGSFRDSAVSFGGSNNTNTVHHGGTDAAAPGAAQLLEAVLNLRAALVRVPRGEDRTALDAELDGIAEQLEGAETIRPGLPARLRAALERWAPLVESVSAAAALGSLLGMLGG
ncbi:hypothetical protein [Streptomyces sp. NRRL F-2580]|uniref:hypothetical protein n=1 Tax=Streptomyces sp. NRRL F-2580 TaxID=1463841 RepID=UPI00131E9372|nr:hypothetical protein [Streptomyces sp. NRRL F-2580]